MTTYAQYPTCNETSHYMSCIAAYYSFITRWHVLTPKIYYKQIAYALKIGLAFGNLHNVLSNKKPLCCAEGYVGHVLGYKFGLSLSRVGCTMSQGRQSLLIHPSIRYLLCTFRHRNTYATQPYIKFSIFTLPGQYHGSAPRSTMH